MNKLIPIIDYDVFWPEEVTVRRISDDNFPELYLKNVIDLASIVWTHHGIPKDCYMYEYVPVYPYNYS